MSETGHAVNASAWTPRRWRLVAALAALLVLALDVVQIAALRDGLERWVGWPALIDWLVAIPLGVLPVIGALSGAAGAVSGWGWGVPAAVLLAVASLAAYWVSALAQGRLRTVRSEAEGQGGDA